MTKKQILQKNKTRANKTSLDKLPTGPGIYIFFNDSGTIIYIGKSTNIKSRVTSYFATRLLEKTANLMSEAKELSYVKVNSELEALLLEAKLIHSYQPKYNSANKDDKHPLYIKITSDKYPQVLTARKIEDKTNNKAFFGPYPSAYSVHSILKIARRLFPYAQHNPSKKRCFYSHIGKCDPCPSYIESTLGGEKTKLRKQYNENIRNIIGLLSGKMPTVRNRIYRTMLKHSRKQEFEQAKLLREKIGWIDYITQPVAKINEFLTNPNFLDDVREEEAAQLRNIISEHIELPERLSRIECFDVAHITGFATTASMVTFIDGEAEKKYYRHFRIRQKSGMDDVASLRETVLRRSRHFKDWGKPDLVIVDGGKGQVSVFVKALVGHEIAVVGIAKRFETLIIPIVLGEKIKYVTVKLNRSPALNLVQRLRNEAHRFARRYHHQLVKKSLLQY